MYGFYKLRRNRLLTGTLAGLADKFRWDVWLVRAIFLAIVLLTKIAWLAMILYGMASIYLPIKEEVDAERYGTGPRKRKDAEKANGGGFF
jgi:phage shock protein PspC (stress-responsive transcriptional regulator)